MVNQGPGGEIDAFYVSWQKSLEQLVPSFSHDPTLSTKPFLNNLSVGARVSRQIFELLGENVFPSTLEAELITLKEIFAQFDDLKNQHERRSRLVEARKVLGRLTSVGVTRSLPSSQTSSLPHPQSQLNTSIPLRSQSNADLWNIPVRFAKGVGPSRARLFAKLGVTTIEEAFWFLPWRYEDWSVIVPITQLRSDMKVTVEGRVTACHVRQTSRKKLVLITITVDDGTGVLDAVFFNQPFLAQIFTPGTALLLRGDVLMGQGGAVPLHMRAPQHELIRGDGDSRSSRGRLVPVYHETKGLTSRQLRRVLNELYEQHGHEIEEILPSSLLTKLKLPALGFAMSALHFPDSPGAIDTLNEGSTRAHQRLAFEELLLLQLALAMRRRMMKAEIRGITFNLSNSLTENFRNLLPFTLTTAQCRVIQEIESDMASSRSMNRLLQGDVGSGKTIVALHAMVAACGSGYQAVLMAPTEVLSEQHFLTVEPYFRQLGLTAVFVKGGQSTRQRIKSLDQLASGQAQVAVRTHALLQPDVIFANLGLVVVDEQHKFGVVQRAQLRKKSLYPPDVLVMTATPIPRTLAMTVYGDLDVSVIDKLPPGRKVVRTQLFQDIERSRAYEFLRKEVTAGRQAYIVYPLVEPSEKIDLQAAVQAAEHLQREEFPESKIGLLHGRMKSKEKHAVMAEFKAGHIQILVATTVIEVGVDVSNATVILIEHAERFGLAQLHQLRGRVGRGAQQSYCFLLQSAEKSETHRNMNPELPLTLTPLSLEDSESTQLRRNTQQESRRLRVLTRCADGFSLAEEDLKMRGPGNVLGVQQWGTVEFLVANLLRDRQLLLDARRVARDLLSKDPQLHSFENQGLKAAMLRKWGKTFELGDIG